MPASLAHLDTEPVTLSSLVAGQSLPGSGPSFSSLDPWTQRPVAIAEQAGSAEVSRAAAAAALGQAELASLSWTARAGILERTAELVRERADRLVELAVREVGKPVSEARAEVTRVGAVLAYYAQEARRAKGEMIPA